MFSTDSSKEKTSRPSASLKPHNFHDTLHKFAHKHKKDLPIVISLLQGFQEIIAGSPLSFLAPVLAILSQLISTIKDADGNRDDGHIIASKVSEYITMIQAYANCSDVDSLRALQQNDTTIYLHFLKQAEETAAKVAGQKPLTAFFHVFENKAVLEKTLKEVDSSRIEFMLKTVLAMSKKLDELYADLKDETYSNHEPNPSIHSVPPTSKDHAQHSRALAHERSSNPVARMVNPLVSGVAKQPNMKTPDQTRPPLSMPVPQINSRIHKHIRMPEPELYHLPPRYYH